MSEPPPFIPCYFDPYYHQYYPVPPPVVPPPQREKARLPWWVNRKKKHANVVCAVVEAMLDELRDILERDLHKKMIENTAYKTFDQWWASEEQKQTKEEDRPILPPEPVTMGLGLRAAMPKMPSFRVSLVVKSILKFLSDLIYFRERQSHPSERKEKKRRMKKWSGECPLNLLHHLGKGEQPGCHHPVMKVVLAAAAVVAPQNQKVC